MKKQHMLVLGASGFIGRHTLNRALAAGWHVDAVMRSPETSDGFANLTESYPDSLQIQSGFELADSDALSKLVKDIAPDVVVHAAAIGAKPGHYGATGVVSDNVMATSTLLDVCHRIGVGQVILFGSAICYGPSSEPHDEDELLQPENEYGLSKTLCAELAAYHNRTGYDRVIELRPFNIYGPDDAPKRLIPYIIGQTLVNQPIELTSGEQQRDFVYVQDLVDIVLAAANGDLPAGAYNVATQAPVSVVELARLLISLTDSASELRLGAVATRSDRHQVLSGRIVRLKKLNLAPKTSLRDGLLATIEATRSVISSPSS